MAKIISAKVWDIGSTFDPQWRTGPMLVGEVFYTGPVDGGFRFIWEITRHDKSKATVFDDEDKAKLIAGKLLEVVNSGLSANERGEVNIMDVG